MIIQTVGWSARLKRAGPSQFTKIITIATTAITIPKTTLIIIPITTTTIVPRITGLLAPSIAPTMINLTAGLRCQPLTVYYNNNNNSENKVDNNFKGNGHHLRIQVDYNNALTINKPYTATKCNANDDNNKGRLSYSHDIAVNYNNENPKSMLIIIPTAKSTTIVLLLKTTMITIRMATKSVPSL